jgi:hypothetical protein
MNKKTAQGVLSKDEEDIRELIERWAKAVRDVDRAGICTDHDPDILMFDVPPPLFSQGLDSYMATSSRLGTSAKSVGRRYGHSSIDHDCFRVLALSVA